MSPYSQEKPQKNRILGTGRPIFGGDGTDYYPIKVLADTAGLSGRQVISQREPFIFRPGAAALASGMVPSGTRSGAATITTGGTADSTYWGGWQTYQPLRSGRIDGKASGGIIEGQLTIGHKSAAGTVNIKVTARIANTANTSAPTTMLAVTAATSVTTTETFTTYDIPYLACDTVMNSVPFSVAIGIQTAVAASAGIARIMESSVIMGEFEPDD